MYHQTATPFNDMQKAIALALHDAGQTDREIADGCSTSVNNIIWWRKEAGLSEHLSPEAAARAEEERYTPPVSRAKVVQPASVSTSPRNDGLISPATARAVFQAPVQPEGDNALEIGSYLDAKVYVDLQSLLETRLLIQGNSGSGKSHLLRRILEECTGIVQQIIIDPEGDFVGFSNTFGHTVVTAIEHDIERLASIAALVRQHRGSVVLNLDGLDFEGQMNAAAAFLTGLFNVPAEHWHPAIVAVDEAHLFAPAGDNGESKEVRKASQTAKGK